MGDHHPQLGAALPGVVGIFGQAVYLFQHPCGLLDEPPPLLGGDHAGGGALKDADVILLFQIFQRLADVGLGGVELLCRSAHRAPFLNGNEITQFCDVQSSSLLVNADSPLFYQPGGRRVKPRLTPRRAGLIIKKNAPLKSRAGGGNMERYRVVRLEEQMYGCEELPEGAEVCCDVTVEAADGTRKTLSYPDAELTRQGIDEGDTVLWDGTALRKA